LINLPDGNDFDIVSLETRNTADTIDDSGAITYVDTDNYDLGTAATLLAAIRTTSTVNLTGGDLLSQSGEILASSGTTTLTFGGANNITLTDADNNFQTVVLVSGNAVTLVDTNSINLGAATVSGLYDITADAVVITGAVTSNSLDIDTFGGAGTISDTTGTLTVTTTTILRSQVTDDIILNGANDFGGVVTISSGNSVTLVDVNSINLGPATVSALYDITADSVVISGAVSANSLDIDAFGGVGTITDTTGTLNVTTTTALRSQNTDNITLDGLNTFTGTITIPSGQDVILHSSGAVVLGAISVRNLTINAARSAAGGISQTGILTLSQTGTFDLATSLGDIDLSTQDNDIAGVITVGTAPNVRDLFIRNINGNASVPLLPATDLDDLTLDFPNAAITLPTINITGNLNVISGGNITDSGTLTIAGTVTMNANGVGSDIILDDDGAGGYTNTYGILSLTATDDAIIVYEVGDSTYSSVTAGTLSATSTTGNIYDSGSWTIAGNTTIDAAADITLDNGSTFGTLLLNGTIVTIVETGPTDLGASTIGSNFFITSSGAITDTGIVNVTGTSTFTTTAGNSIIDLDAANIFTNAVHLFPNGSGNGSVNNVNGNLILGNITCGGNLTASASGSISDITDVTISVTGLGDLTAGTTILLGNDVGDVINFGSLDLQGTSITFTEDSASVLADVDTVGTFTLTSAGNIDDSGTLTIGDVTTLTANGGLSDILLDQAASTFGTFVLTAANADITEAADTDLGLSTVTGTLDITATGRIDDSGTLAIGGDTTLSANGGLSNILLDQVASTFGTLILTGANIDITEAAPTDLGACTVNGTFDIVSTGNISDSGTLNITGNSTFTAADTSSIILNEALNNFILGATVSFLSGGTLNNVTVVDQDQFDIQALTIGGVLNVTTAGAITQSGPINTGGNITLTSSASTVSVTNTVTTGAGGNVIITNNGLLTISALMTLGGTFTQNGAGLVDISANIFTTTDTISFLRGVTLSGPVVLSTGVGTGDILFSSTLTGGSNNLSLYPYSGLCTVTGVLSGVDTLNIHDNNAGSTGAFLFTESVTANTIVTQAYAHNITFNNGGTITNSITFTNTGILTLGNAAGDIFDFTAGITATAPATKNIAGSIRAAGTGVINLDTTPINITATSTIGGTSTGTVTLADLTMVDGITLTLGASANTPYSCGAINGTAGGTVSDLVISTLGTVTLSGAIGTDTGNLTILSGTLNAAGNTISLTENWTNNATFIHGDNSVVLGSGGAGPYIITSNGSNFYDLTITSDTYSLSDLLEVDNSLDVIGGGIFQPGNNQITFNGVLWDTSAGTFDHTISSGLISNVIYTNSGTITIRGDNSFYNFEYQIPGGTILFREGDTQFVLNKFTVVGGSGNQITLTSENPVPSPVGDGPEDQWIIDIDFPVAGGSATATIIEVLIINSRAVNPIAPQAGCTDGGNNDNWFFFIDIIVSWTEDSDLNGRIDRIRVRVESIAFLNAPQLPIYPDFRYDDITAYIDGYDVDTSRGYNGFDDSDNGLWSEFFIYLVEKDYTDTSVTPQWKLLTNSTLLSTTGGALVEYGPTVPLQTPLDNAAPIINYTLASGEKDKIYVEFSEPVRTSLGGVISAGDFTYTGASNISGVINRISVNGNGTSELELSLDSPVDVNEILLNTQLQINTDLDDNVDWDNLSNYPSADQTALPAPYFYSLPLLPLDGTGALLLSGSPVATHRVSDIALGLTGDGIVQPVYATDEAETDLSRGGIGLVKDFTGGEWLQDQAIEINSHINNGIVATAVMPDVQLLFDVDIPTSYRQNYAEDGLWLPSTYDPLDFYGIVPAVNLENRTVDMGTSPSAQLRVHNVDNDDPELLSVSLVEFLYYIDPDGSGPLGLYAARIENSSASDWYRQLKPWSFSIHDITPQVGGVTILRNVINPEEGETTNLHYELLKEGMVTIQVFDISGAMVDILYRGRQAAGDYSTAWDGRNSGGRVVARGVYFIRIVAPDMDETRKVMVVK
ncbi:MAG: hypothetical protein JEY91_10425, partial [Spirochaetaceae bacterium]|nr:hypothetical protein [Spirochaetaceae bacterium]